jgi:ubiquinone/menaquinone biosynthesis C-methylase UbiE
MNMKAKTDEQRIVDEKNFHDDIFSSNARKKVGKFYSINGAIETAYELEIFNQIKGKAFLEYGCGMGSKLLELDKEGALTFGIDISDFAIKELSEKAKQNGSNTVYQVMNAEELTFEDKTFDVIYGSGILHHLSLEKSFKTLSDKLKSNGKAIFIEPLGHNPLINGFRNRTPDIRTEDEHPLLVQDFELARKYFDKVSIQYFYLSTLSLPLLFGQRSPAILVSIFNTIDKAIFALLPPLRRHAWQILLKLESPKH